QELPKPPSMLAWDNAALVSPAAAQRLNLINEQIVELSFQGRSIRAAVWILPGQADDCVTLYLGHGRSAAGGVGSGQGFNAYVLRTAEAMGFGAGLQLQATAQRYLLACVQHHWSMEDRHPVRSGSAEAFAQNPAGLVRNEHEDGRGVRLSLLPEFVYSGQQWGMAIDLSTCIGCRACTIACQAENVIPIVGKENVIRGREMHWIRIDHYYEGSPENPRVYHQPRPCMHCEKAPCELVCPVAATKHSHDGLNEMVYNRCVGTRYCSNNCPYKVRRFNFFDYYSKQDPLSLQLMRNPQVSVRRRGVMEKCTYCVQRIRAVQIQAKREGRAIRDGELMTACQQVCPTDAIVFGDINDPGSGVSAVKRQPHNYGLLAHLNTQPRTTYLAAVRNPNPELA
ncbi:MAG TPA: 4Fe-4S dicluster domain-containing protein, partial [Phycisphaeraceae bacterium]